MAKLRICCNLVFVGKEKLAARVITEGSGTFSPISAFFCTFNPALGPTDMYMDVNM